MGGSPCPRSLSGDFVSGTQEAQDAGGATRHVASTEAGPDPASPNELITHIGDEKADPMECDDNAGDETPLKPERDDGGDGKPAAVEPETRDEASANDDDENTDVMECDEVAQGQARETLADVGSNTAFNDGGDSYPTPAVTEFRARTDASVLQKTVPDEQLKTVSWAPWLELGERIRNKSRGQCMYVSLWDPVAIQETPELGFDLVIEALRRRFKWRFNKGEVSTVTYDEETKRSVWTSVNSFAEMVYNHKGKITKKEYITSLRQRRCLDTVGLVCMSTVHGVNTVVLEDIGGTMKMVKAVVCRRHNAVPARVIHAANIPCSSALTCCDRQVGNRNTGLRACVYSRAKSGIKGDVGHVDELELHADGEQKLRGLLHWLRRSFYTGETSSTASPSVRRLLGAVSTSDELPVGGGKGGSRAGEPTRREGSAKRARKEVSTKEAALPTSPVTDGVSSVAERIGAAAAVTTATTTSAAMMDITAAAPSVATTTAPAGHQLPSPCATTAQARSRLHSSSFPKPPTPNLDPHPQRSSLNPPTPTL